MENNVKIKKAKIKDGLFLEVEYTEDLPGHTKKDNKLSSTVPVHEDLKEAFQNLHKHLAILCDDEKAPGKKQFDVVEYPKFTAKGFSIGGNDENEGVTISGNKDGKYGTVNLNTPFTKWATEDYPFATELSNDVQTCIYEVEEYLFNGKRAPEKQLAIEFEVGEENN